MDDLGERFARALASKDRTALLGLLDEGVDFKALTPNRFWEGSSAAHVVEVLLGSWFEDTDRIETVESVETGSVADRGRVAYLLRVVNDDGPHLVEQQAYYAADGGRVTWLRVLCSGFRPVAP